MSLEDVTIQVEKLTPRPGDLLVVRHPRSIPARDLKGLCQGLEVLAKRFGCQFVTGPDDITFGVQVDPAIQTDLNARRHAVANAMSQGEMDRFGAALEEAAQPAKHLRCDIGILCAVPVDLEHGTDDPRAVTCPDCRFLMAIPPDKEFRDGDPVTFDYPDFTRKGRGVVRSTLGKYMEHTGRSWVVRVESEDFPVPRAIPIDRVHPDPDRGSVTFHYPNPFDPDAPRTKRDDLT